MSNKTYWRNACEIGQRNPHEFWLRWTDGSGVFWWFHDSTGWVTEPAQISQPTYQTRDDAYRARELCPSPPPLLDTPEDTPPAPRAGPS